MRMRALSQRLRRWLMKSLYRSKCQWQRSLSGCNAIARRELPLMLVKTGDAHLS